MRTEISIKKGYLDSFQEGGEVEKFETAFGLEYDLN
jgi:hypothetical protein